jgi:hypothetical protein
MAAIRRPRSCRHRVAIHLAQRAAAAKMKAQHRRNFRFFDAPVGMIFTIHRKLETGSWLDYGMFL